MKFTINALMLSLILSSATAFSVDKMMKHSKMKELTPDQRLQMATSHETMATCLRTEKSMDFCREEMMKSCKDTMGKDSCGYMMGKSKSHEMMADDKTETK
jgi:hypothetical protein